jgi:hypothetical protein
VEILRPRPPPALFLRSEDSIQVKGASHSGSKQQEKLKALKFKALSIKYLPRVWNRTVCTVSWVILEAILILAVNSLNRLSRLGGEKAWIIYQKEKRWPINMWIRQHYVRLIRPRVRRCLSSALLEVTMCLNLYLFQLQIITREAVAKYASE